jgi:hypothetical protein
MKKLTRGKKMNSDIKSLRNETVQGKFIKVETLTNDQGEVIKSKSYGTELYVMTMACLDTGDPLLFWADGGLRGTLKMARVQEGDLIEIVHIGEKDIEQGTVQTYDIFSLVG